LQKDKIEIIHFLNYGEEGGQKAVPEVTYNNKQLSPEILYTLIAKRFHSCMKKESLEMQQNEPQ